MSYDINFSGGFEITPELRPRHLRYLKEFSEVRHMRRNNEKLFNIKDEVRTSVELGLGVDGEYFVESNNNGSILDYNEPPKTQPGLWCDWVPNELGDMIEHNGNEKSSCYVEWIEYLIINFLQPWGYSLNGTVTWDGEEQGDAGKIVIKDNVVKILKAKIVYE